MHTKHRSRSCQLIPLLKSFAFRSQKSEAGSVSISSEMLSLASITKEDSCYQTLKDLVQMLDKCKEELPAEHESAVSQDGSEGNHVDEVQDHKEISIMLDYFAKPEKQEHADALSNGSSFVVISDM